MSSPPTIPVDQLRAPIPGDNPAGKDLRYTPAYDAIKEARRADEEGSRGQWMPSGGLKRADWPTVVRLTSRMLEAESKDVQVAVWLLEAMVQSKGFAGLRDGLHLLASLHEEFWESLYPPVEDGDLEPRAAPLEWLNDKFVRTLRLLPLTAPVSGKAYSWWDFQSALEMENLRVTSPETAEARRAEGIPTKEEFDKAVASTSLAHCQALFADLGEASERCAQLRQVVDAKFGADAPSLLALQQAIDDCRDLVRGFVKDKGGLVEPAAGGGEQAVVHAAGGAGATASGPLPPEPRDRADALERLRAVARFFRRTEPHSPVSYLVQRAAAWGEMPLEKWLREVIANDDVLAHVRETLGLEAPDSKGD